jgi:anti-anti-sigma factor
MLSRFPATSLNATFDGDRAVIRVTDAHFDNLAGAPPGHALFRLIDDLGRSDVALDLENVLFLGSIGLTVLLSLNKQLRAAGGRLALVNVHPHVYEVLTVTRLTTVLEVRPKG